jgi:hypothetical protein
MFHVEHCAAIRAVLPLPLGEGRGEGVGRLRFDAMFHVEHRAMSGEVASCCFLLLCAKLSAALKKARGQARS